jgi:DNA-binding transcriptional regulator YiaG
LFVTDDHAVPIYKNSQPVKITFTVSKYATRTLGELIRELRLEKGLEQRELAKRLGVHRNTVYDWETDRHRPSPKNMGRLVQLLGISRKRLGVFK